MGFPRGAVEAVEAGKIYFEYPMEDRAVVMFGTFVEPGVEDPPALRKQRIRNLFRNFSPAIQSLIETLPEDVPIFADDLAHVDMQQWYKGRVVLMGDAQHATSPLTGMGASLALEDAYVLARELQSSPDIDTALMRYADLRTERIKKFRQISKKIERWLMVASPVKAAIRDVVLRFIPWPYFSGKLEDLLNQKI